MQLSQFPNTVVALIHDSDKTKPVIHQTTLNAKDIKEGYGAFFTVNGFKGERKKANLSHVTGVFADFDNVGQLQDLPVDWLGALPSIVNQTKNGFHAIWLLEKPIEVDDTNRDGLIEKVEGMNRWMVENWQSDNAATDVGRLLRVPNTEHRKDPNDPFVITTVHEDDVRYTLGELLALFPPIHKDLPEPVYGELTDDASKRIERMLERPNVRALWDGDVPEDKLSESDASLCCHLAFWLAKDYTAIEQAWLQSPLGQREKTQERADYRKMTIDRAVALTTDVYTPSEVAAFGDNTELDVNELMHVIKNKGKENEYVEYLTNDENIIYILNFHQLARYDQFKNRAYIYVNNEWRIRDDGGDGLLYTWLVRQYPFLAKVSSRRVADLVTLVQYRNTFDSAQDYLNSLEWDGVARLDSWLSNVFFVEDCTYYRDIGSKWFMGMAARIMYPGCKFDNALIVHGGQKIGKSSVFLIIAGEDSHIEFTDLHVREMQQDIQGKLIVEFAEAAIFSKADSESLKSIVSRQTDTFRVPYERHPKDFPRRNVFAVTANNDDILKDSTGGRRWWVVDVPDDMKVYPPKRQADIHWLKENRDQLFAEAAHRVREGEDYHNVDEYELIKRQRGVTATEQDEDLFYDWYHSLRASEQNEGMTLREAYVGAYKQDYRGERLDVTTTPIKKSDEMRVGRILKKLGLEKKKTNGRVVWVPGEMFDRSYEVKLYKTRHEYSDASW